MNVDLMCSCTDQDGKLQSTSVKVTLGRIIKKLRCHIDGSLEAKDEQVKNNHEKRFMNKVCRRRSCLCNVFIYVNKCKIDYHRLGHLNDEYMSSSAVFIIDLFVELLLSMYSYFTHNSM